MKKISEIVLSSNLYFPKGEVDVGELEGRFTFSSKFDEGKEISLLHRTKSWVGIPRHYYGMDKLDAMAGRVIDLRQRGTSLLFEMKKPLWEEQEKIINQVAVRLEKGYTGIIIEAPAGSGKTILGMKSMQLVGCTTLIVVPRSTLVYQWRARLLEFTSLMEREIGIVEGTNVRWRGTKVVCALVHTLALDRLGTEFKRRFGLALFDEVDRSVPPQTFAPVVGLFPSWYRIGMTATVDRKDGLDVIFKYHIGETRVGSSRSENVMKPKVLRVLYTRSSGSVWRGSKKMNRRGMLISKLAENPHRNAVLCEYIKLMLQSGRRCVVISDRKEQLVSLSEVLTGSNGIDRKEIGFYVRELRGKKKSQRELECVGRTCSIILATYGMFAVGTDIQDMAGLVFATPQSDIRQSAGRIERILEGKKDPVIVDLVDYAYPDALNWANARNAEYKRRGLGVKEM